MSTPSTRFRALVFFTATCATLAVINAASGGNWAAPAVAAVTCVVFAVVTRPRRNKS